AQRLLDEIETKKLFRPRAVAAFWPANRRGDDVVVYSDDRREQEVATFHFLRQQRMRSDDAPYLCLADFIAPEGRGLRDYIGGFAVTTGAEVERIANGYSKRGDDFTSIMIKSLGDR